ncbi:MAG: hypothetical protein RMM58_10400 [Chloroflexota bacterium]|nr:hypothetical protein [Dehalococcoidia bacterium]MDW8254275.1 hypothetical protein [Chloroflexota bacterium]
MKHSIARTLARVTVALGILAVLGAATVASVFAWRLAPAPETATAAPAPVVETVSPDTWRMLHQLTFEPWVLSDVRLFSATKPFGAEWLELTFDPRTAVATPAPMSALAVAQLTFAPWELAGE